MAADEILCKVRQRVISTAYGQVGDWSLTAAMYLPIVPRSGDRLAIPLATTTERVRGEHTGVVMQVTLVPGGPPRVELHPIVSGSGEIISELADRGWDQAGEPWPGQAGAPG